MKSFTYKIISDNCRMRGATRTLILELGLQTKSTPSESPKLRTITNPEMCKHKL